MIYLDRKDRREILLADPWGSQDVDELSYIITSLALDYLPPEPKFADYNAVIGVLECVKQELYRRAVGTYEDTKIVTHGDIDGYSNLPHLRIK